MTDHKRTYSQRGDDYLLEAQKVCGEDKREYDKPTPRCPYCGGKMKKRVLSDYTILCFWLCPKCSATSPSADTAEDAYTAAMRRWKEPNRVLTLEEIKEQRAVWVEKVGFYPVPAIFYSYRYPHHSVFGGKFEGRDDFDDNNLYDNEGYRVAWRCWLRKPTAEEMATMPWREK